jgi:hypothetical protein
MGTFGKVFIPLIVAGIVILFVVYSCKRCNCNYSGEDQVDETTKDQVDIETEDKTEPRKEKKTKEKDNNHSF